jgi:alpha-beta hydrolase superfamily lysophospholipase
VLAGCGGSHQAARPPAPSLSSVCGSTVHGQATWLRTSDGVRLYSAALGSGSTTFVLAHESPGGMCGWLPAMQFLTRHGYRALAFDFRGFPPSGSPPMAIYNDLGPDLQAAIDAAHDDGAKKVVVMGASFGGAAAVTFGSKLHGVDGIVNLSGELNLPGRSLDTLAQAPKLRTPLLIVAGHDDPYLDVHAAGTLLRVAGSSERKLIVVPGAYHGWDLLDLSPFRRHLWAAILAWVAAR